MKFSDYLDDVYRETITGEWNEYWKWVREADFFEYAQKLFGVEDPYGDPRIDFIEEIGFDFLQDKATAEILEKPLDAA